MNFKNIILSVALILGSCSDSVLVAQPANEQSELIKKAKDAFDELRKALKCVFRKKGCDEKKRKEIIVKGLKILGVAAVLTAVVLKFKPISPAAAKNAYERIDNFLNVVMGGAGAFKTHKKIQEWLSSMKESRHATEETGFVEQKNDAYLNNYKAASEAYENEEYQKAYRLIKAASKAIINANKRYEKELEKDRMQKSRRGKEEE